MSKSAYLTGSGIAPYIRRITHRHIFDPSTRRPAKNLRLGQCHGDALHDKSRNIFRQEHPYFIPIYNGYDAKDFWLL